MVSSGVGPSKPSDSKKMSSLTSNKLKKPAVSQAPVISSGVPVANDDDDAIMIDMEPVSSMAGPSAATNPKEGGDTLMKFGEVKEQKNSKGLTQTAKVSFLPQAQTIQLYHRS